MEFIRFHDQMGQFTMRRANKDSHYNSACCQCKNSNLRRKRTSLFKAPLNSEKNEFWRINKFFSCTSVRALLKLLLFPIHCVLFSLEYLKHLLSCLLKILEHLNLFTFNPFKICIQLWLHLLHESLRQSYHNFINYHKLMHVLFSTYSLEVQKSNDSSSIE